MLVLLASDDASLRLLVQEVLGALGHEVHVVADGEAAWAAWQQDRRPLVLLDRALPGVDGVEVTRRIRASGDAGAETFVIVVTATDAGAGLGAVLDAGADDFLARPVSADGLRARLAIAGRRIAHEQARRRAEEELARARWLAGIGETTLAIQHELNNPLAALLGNAALIEARIIRPDEYEETVAIITEQAKRIAAVVKRLASLREPRSVEYVQGTKMIDLSAEE